MSTVSKCSEELDHLVCRPCSLDGKSKAAQGFCDTCKEHLCLYCFNNHRIPLVCRDHVMLDKAAMPKEIVTARDALSEICEKHGHLLEYFCEKDNSILCNVCVTIYHKNCGIRFIPDVSENVGNSRELSNLRNNISGLIERVKENKENIVGNKADIEMLKEDTKSRIRHLKEDFVRLFDKLEMSLDREIDQIAETDLLRMEEISDSCDAMEIDLQKISTELDDRLNRNKNNKLFTAMKKAEKKMVLFQVEIEKIDSKNCITQYGFEPDVEFQRMQSSVTSLGKLRCYKVKSTHVQDINVRSELDNKECYVTGLSVISHNRVAICDSEFNTHGSNEDGICGNSSVKLIDTKHNKVVSQIRLPSDPWDTALVPGESSAHDLIVSLPRESKLYFVRVTENQLADMYQDIAVDGWCQGIRVTLDRTLAVSFWDPGKVEILSMDGNVLRRIQTDHSNTQLFHDPQYLAVCPCSGWVYVSDWRKNTLFRVCTRDGSVTPVLKGLVGPRGVTVDKAGEVFVCCEDRTVHRTNAKGDRVTQILCGEHVLCPMAIALSPENDQMYLSNYNSDIVQNFQLVEGDK